jgi:hypothetical protein
MTQIAQDERIGGRFVEIREPLTELGEARPQPPGFDRVGFRLTSPRQFDDGANDIDGGRCILLHGTIPSARAAQWS